MNNLILDGGDVVYYVVRVNGQVMSQKYSQQFMAEQHRDTMSEDMKNMAEIVPVTADNKELLLG